MTFENWLTFALTSAAVVALPGPTVLLVVAYSLGHGRRSARAAVAGVGLGDFTAMTASLLGLGALLAASATAFTVVKWLGAAYLLYLGVKMWRAPVAALDAGEPELAGAPRPASVFAHAWLVTALNPKSIVFFVAFLPLFIEPTHPLLLQLVVMEATFLVLAVANAAAYAWLAGLARGKVRQPSVRRAVNRIGGSLMIGAGILALALRRGPA